MNSEGYRARVLGPTLAEKVTNFVLRVVYITGTALATIGLYATASGWAWIVALDWKGFEQATEIRGFIASGFTLMLICVGLTTYYAVKKSKRLAQEAALVEGDPYTYSKAGRGGRVETVEVGAPLLFRCFEAIHAKASVSEFDALLRELGSDTRLMPVRAQLMAARKRAEQARVKEKYAPGDTVRFE